MAFSMPVDSYFGAMMTYIYEVGAECIEVKGGTSCTLYAYGRHVAYDIAVSGEDGSMAVINSTTRC